MKRKEFLAKLGSDKGKNLVIEIEGEIIQKVTIEKMGLEIEEDRIYIQDSINLDFVVIYLNTIRDIIENPDNITLFIEDSKETKIKISVKSL